MRITYLPLLLCLCASHSAAGEEAGRAAPAVIDGRVTWTGTVRLGSPVVVGPEGVLTLEPGTNLIFQEAGALRIEGRLVVAGSRDRPVKIEGRSLTAEAGIVVTGERASAEVAGAEVSGLKAAFALQAAGLSCRLSRFQKCGTALSLDVKAKAAVEASAFEDCDVGVAAANGSRLEMRKVELAGNRRGIGLTGDCLAELEELEFRGNETAYSQHRSTAATLTRCTFRRNRVAVDLNQTGKGPLILRSSFEDNETAVRANLFSHPRVEATTFAGNGTALAAFQMCGPLVWYNEFRKNKTAVSLDRRSDGLFKGNLLRGNGVGFFADFSSYPQVEGNLLDENDWHARLGSQQSADFERRFGSAGLRRGQAGGHQAAANGRVPAPLRAEEPSLEGRVFSLRLNAWDEQTRKQIAEGPDVNLARIWDGRDQPPVAYEGFGEERYAVDMVEFSPPVSADGLAVGPSAWRPYEKDDIRSGVGAGTPAKTSP